MAKNNFEELKKILLAEKEKYDAEQEFKETVRRVYSKKPINYNRMTGSVKKSAHLNAGGLDLHKDENRHYSRENTERYLGSSSYMETYNAMKEQDSWD
tara:strand:- start:4213 stop:4506 length:294 start_codon:yes stop_codon:yes gene_type:complete